MGQAVLTCHLLQALDTASRRTAPAEDIFRRSFGLNGYESSPGLVATDFAPNRVCNHSFTRWSGPR